MSNNDIIHIEDTSDIYPVSRADLSLLTNDNVFAMSVMKKEPYGVTKYVLKDNGNPVVGSSIDPRFGVVTGGGVCPVCKGDYKKCMGHFCHSRMVIPMYNYTCINYTLGVLACICFSCGFPLVHENQAFVRKLFSIKKLDLRFAEAKKLSKPILVCANCNLPAHKVVLEKKTNKFYISYKIKKKSQDEESKEGKKKAMIFTTEKVRRIFAKVSPITHKLLGFNPAKFRFTDFLITNLVFAPIHIRPSSVSGSESGAQAHDGLTNIYNKIVHLNENLKNTRSDGHLHRGGKFGETLSALQIFLINLVTSDVSIISKTTQKNGTVIGGVDSKLKGKFGRMRGNLMGKRVDFSARNTISGNPDIDIDCVAIPFSFATTITVPEDVTPANIERLRSYILNGDNYPGANVVKIRNNAGKYEKIDTFDLRHADKQKIVAALKPGDVVYRHLLNGDMAIVNRQPSLHKFSIMALIVTIIKDPNIFPIGINTNVTKPFNADFDGDEMNCFFVAGKTAEAELRILMSVGSKIMSSSNSKPIIGPKQDSVIGICMMSMDDVFVSSQWLANALTSVTLEGNKSSEILGGKSREDRVVADTYKGVTSKSTILPIYKDDQKAIEEKSLIVPKNRLFSGREAINYILPPNINYKRDGLEISNSKLIYGTLKAKDLETIVQLSLYTNGSKITLDFIDNTQRFSLQFLKSHGFSVGIGELVFPEQVKRSIREIIASTYHEILSELTEYDNCPRGVIGKNITTIEGYEAHVISKLQNAQKAIQSMLMNTIDPKSGFALMVNTDTSGSPSTITSICGAVGTTIVNRKRIQMKYNNRTTPHYTQFDSSPAARGFCANNFMTGLDSKEMFFHLMSACEGLINTNVKTADTGYIVRRMVKVMEDMKVCYDGSVRNGNGNMVQFVYGDNGISTERQQGKQKLITMSMSNQEIFDKCLYTIEEINNFPPNHLGEYYTDKINNDIGKKIITLRDNLRFVQSRMSWNLSNFEDTYFFPVNLNQYIQEIIVSRKSLPNQSEIVHPLNVLKMIVYMYSDDRSKIVYYPNEKKDKFPIKTRDDGDAKTMLKYYLFDVLAPRRVTHEYQLTTLEFREVARHFFKKIQIARVNPGDLVGVSSAQDIIEPITQANLKSFHVAGSGKTMTRGVQRLKELFENKRDISTPKMRVVLKREYCTDRRFAEIVANILINTTFINIASSAVFQFDGNLANPQSYHWIDRTYNIINCDLRNEADNKSLLISTPFIFRIILSKQKMISRHITMNDIKTAFCENWNNRNSILGDVTGKSGAKVPKKDYKKIIEKVTRCVLTTNDEDAIIHVRFDMSDFNFSTIIKFFCIVMCRFSLKGYQGIVDADVIEEKNVPVFQKDGSIARETQYYVVTDGINLPCLSDIRIVDLTRSYCNSVLHELEYRGLDAARNLYIMEFTSAIAASDIFVNYQPIEFVTDVVTHTTGGILTINRHGANKLETGPFSRGTFEKTREQMNNAAMHDKPDLILSNSSKLIFGQPINGGTSSFDISVDLEYERRMHKQVLKYYEKFKAPGKIKITNKNVDRNIPKENVVNLSNLINNSMAGQLQKGLNLNPYSQNQNNIYGGTNLHNQQYSNEQQYQNYNYQQQYYDNQQQYYDNQQQYNYQTTQIY